MENKKLLRYILKDLLELEEMFAGKESLQFDEIETEFIQNRVISARKLVQLYIGHHEETIEASRNDKAETASDVALMQPRAAAVIHQEIKTEKQEAQVVSGKTAPVTDVEKEVKKTSNEEPVKTMEKPKVVDQPIEHHPVKGVMVNEILEYFEDTITEIAKEEGGRISETDEDDEWRHQENEKSVHNPKAEIIQQELRLEDAPEEDQQNKRLGDSFSKEKSVNDLVSSDTQKLENKISNMPVSSIQAAIGINDRFQYIRELFDGNADKYNDTILKLDSMADLKEAVVFLQQNFKWKKTEVSLKFVTLIKRRFPQ